MIPPTDRLLLTDIISSLLLLLVGSLLFLAEGKQVAVEALLFGGLGGSLASNPAARLFDLACLESLTLFLLLLLEHSGLESLLLGVRGHAR